MHNNTISFFRNESVTTKSEDLFSVRNPAKIAFSDQSEFPLKKHHKPEDFWNGSDAFQTSMDDQYVLL